MKIKADLFITATIVLTTIILLCPAFLAAQVSVSTQLSPSAILIGDQSLLSIIATYPSNTSIEKVDFSVLEGLNNLEVLNAEQWEKEANGDKLQTIIELKITCWEEGSYEIPPIPIIYADESGKTQTSASTAQVLNVGTIPVEQDSLQLMPIKEIINESINFRDALPYLIGLLLLIILGLVIYFLTRKKEIISPPPPPISVLAHELALQGLKELEQRNLWQEGEVKLYHSELTRVLRAYLEHRYSINALELTSDEILQSLEQQGMEGEMREQLASLLRTVDLVKFAKAEPPPAFHNQAMENVAIFIQETKDDELRVTLAAGTPIPEGVAIEEVIVEDNISGAEYSFALAAPNGHRLVLANFWPRFWARLIDVNLIPLLYLTAAFLIGEALESVGGIPDSLIWVFVLFSIIFFWFFYAFMEYKYGGTIGKLLLGISVVTKDGVYQKLGRASIRFIGRLLSEGLFGLGYLLYFSDKKKRQTLHDRIAKTYVVNKFDQNINKDVLDGDLRP